MEAVEFQTKVKDGFIEIPEVYRNRFKDRVRVIVIADEQNLGVDLIKQLLENPLNVVGFRPLTRAEIYEQI